MINTPYRSPGGAMTTSPPKEVTQLLLAWNGGNEDALNKLIPLVHAELRQAAKRYMRRERAGHTLQTSALVNEVYLRLIEARNVEWRDRAHFFAISAQLMRRVLVDFARRRNQLKRGGEARHISIEEALDVSDERGADVIALDDALNELAKLNQRQSRVVELRFFGGLTEEEIAEVLKISPRTVRNDWRLARAWLYRELSKEKDDDA